MLSHTSCGDNSITNTSYNIKYTNSPHNPRSLASRPRILQQLFYLRRIGYKTRKKDRIEGCFVENTAGSYILAEDLTNTDWFQHVLNSPIISFSVCIGGFRAFARVIPPRRNLSKELTKSRRVYMENITGIKGILWNLHQSLIL
jgi:hypothetical protein